MKKSTAVLLALMFCLAVSCRKMVMEQREDCPFKLGVDLSQLDGVVRRVNLWIVGEREMVPLISREIGVFNFGRELELPLERGVYRWYLWGGIGRGTQLGESPGEAVVLGKRLGVSADSLWLCAGDIDASIEGSTTVKALLSKEFFTCRLRLRNGISFGETMVVECTGTTVGYEMDGTIIGGEDNVLATACNMDVGICEAEFRMLRQSTLSPIRLTISILDDEGMHRLTKLDLGSLLREIGYDMRGELRDLDFTLDAALSLFSIRVEGWNKTVETHIEF